RQPGGAKSGRGEARRPSLWLKLYRYDQRIFQCCPLYRRNKGTSRTEIMAFALRAPRASVEQELPSEIYVPLADSLYKEGRTLFVGSIMVIGSVLTTYWKTGEVLLLACALTLAIVACVRVWEMRAYARARSEIRGNADARRWEHRYVTGAA